MFRRKKKNSSGKIEDMYEEELLKEKERLKEEKRVFERRSSSEFVDAAFWGVASFMAIAADAVFLGGVTTTGLLAATWISMHERAQAKDVEKQIREIDLRLQEYQNLKQSIQPQSIAPQVDPPRAQAVHPQETAKHDFKNAAACDKEIVELQRQLRKLEKKTQKKPKNPGQK